MRCNSVRKKVFLYLEDKLPKEERIKIKEHLKTCAWCTSEYKKTEKMMDAFTSGSPKVLPENLHKNIMIEIKGQKAFNEEEKRESIMAMHRAIRRAGVVFASVFVVFFTLQFIDFETLKEKGFEGLMELNKVANEAIEESKTENTAKAEASLNTTFDKVILENEKDNIVKNEDISENDIEVKEEMRENLATQEGKNDFSNLYDYDQNFQIDNVVKESILEIYTPNFDDSLSQIKNIANKNSSTIYYQNIYHDDESSEKYKVAVIALKINEDKFDTVKAQIEKIGYYKVNIEQEKEEDKLEDLSQLLLECKNKKVVLTEELNSVVSEDEKVRLQGEIEGIEKSIINLENQLAKESNVQEIVKLEVTLKECSELDIEGIISKETYLSSIKKSFTRGYEKFIRVMQNAFLWICENVMFIIVYAVLFIIVYFIFKGFFLKDKE